MKVAILGYGVEGKSAEKFLKMKYPATRIEIRDLKIQGKNYLKGLEKFDMVVRSPGIPYLSKEIQKAKKAHRLRSGQAGVKITSTTKLFFENAKGILVGITGTKGKGTTATLLYKILKNSHLASRTPSGRNIHLIGNMGIPMLDELPKLKENSISIIELSSFQLQDLDVSPHIAVISDVSPDHLNYHKNMKEYLNAKSQIVSNPLPKPQTFQDFSQRDGARLSNSPARLAEAPAKRAGEYAGLEKFGGKVAVFFFSDNKFSKQIAEKGQGKKVAVRADNNLKLRIPGAHNLKNASMAAAIARALGVKENIINKTIRYFKGLPHRLEFVREINGVKFYNDSASTNPAATIAALKAFPQPKILIAGGASKGASFAPLGKAVKSSKTKLVILYGANKKEIGKVIGNISKIYSDKLRFAVKFAFQNSKKGDVILFSPASASFDMFVGYGERGDDFKKIVNLIRG